MGTEQRFRGVQRRKRAQIQFEGAARSAESRHVQILFISAFTKHATRFHDNRTPKAQIFHSVSTCHAVL